MTTEDIVTLFITAAAPLNAAGYLFESPVPRCTPRFLLSYYPAYSLWASPGLLNTMVWLKCVCHIRKTRFVIVPWAHIQPFPGHIYNCALDTFYKRVVDTFKYVSLPHLYMEKR